MTLPPHTLDDLAAKLDDIRDNMLSTVFAIGVLAADIRRELFERDD